jgi:hypothetical protein
MTAHEIRNRLEAVAGHEVRFTCDGVMRHVLLDPGSGSETVPRGHFVVDRCRRRRGRFANAPRSYRLERIKP